MRPSLFFSCAVLFCASPVGPVHAGHSTIEVGAGTDYNSENSGIGLLFRVGMRKVSENGKFLCVNGRDWIVSTNLYADLTVQGAFLGNGEALPSFLLELFPVVINHVDCTEAEPLDEDHTEYQLLPTSLARSHSRDQNLAIVVSLIGVDWSIGSGANQRWTRETQESALRFVTRVTLMGPGLRRDFLNQGLDTKGIQFFFAQLQESLSYTLSHRCDFAMSGYGSAEYSSGTAGLRHEYTAGGKLGIDCMSRSGGYDEYSIETQSIWWGDEINLSDREIRVIVGYGHRF